MTSTPPVLDLKEVRTHYRTAVILGTPAAMWTALADVPALLAAIRHYRAVHTLTRTRYADLLAAARATLSADQDAEPDPLYYLRDELHATGHLPARWDRP
jgi:hypothetical protein